MHLQYLKVQRNKVIKALKWLELHHTEYNDITINKLNLGWINDQSEAVVLDQVQNYQVKGAQSKKLQLPSVSEVQCFASYDPYLNLNYATVA